MITAITIENFKGIRGPFQFQLKPLTLLFGPNSAGKSSLIQSLHYAREVLQRRNFDASKAQAAPTFVDFGGFSSFVHNHDANRAVTMKLEIDRGEAGLVLDEVNGNLLLLLKPQHREVLRSIPYSVAKARVDFSVADVKGAITCVNYAVVIDDVQAAEVRLNQGRTEMRVNFAHPSLIPRDEDKPLGKRARKYWDYLASLAQPFGSMGSDSIGALPDVEGLILPTHPAIWSPPDLYTHQGWMEAIRLGIVLNRFVAAPTKAVLAALQKLCYLGPFRHIPERHAPISSSVEEDWATGTAAWSALQRANEKLLADVNRWLSAAHLGTGYCVKRRVRREIDVESTNWTELFSATTADDVHKRLLAIPKTSSVGLYKEQNGLEVQPRDLGVGISQVLPVILACLNRNSGITCIEQPELHLHPRMQCELGDLLIQTALPRRQPTKMLGLKISPEFKPLIVETHSEHLILRILRRIRETTRGQPHNGIPVTPDDVAVIYVSQEDGQSVPRTIPIDEHGEFTVPWPDDFFESDFYERIG